MQIINSEYKDWLQEVKQHIREARLKVALAANSELVFFYFELGKMLLAKSKDSQWGNNWLGQLSIDLRKDFPDMEGFSKTNLYNIKRFNQFYEEAEFFHQLGGKIASDNPTIGSMICKNKNSIIAEYALKNINQPIGVSEYQLTKLFPEEFKSSLPTIEEIENELKDE